MIACSHSGCRRQARRVFDARTEINARPVSSKFPYTSFRLPTNLPGCRTATKAGHVVIESAAHKDRVFKTHGFVRESGEWS